MNFRSLINFRFFYCLWIAVAIFIENVHSSLVRETYDPLPLLNFLIGPNLVPDQLLTLLYWTLILSLVSAGLGVFQRTSLGISLITFIIYWGSYLGTFKSPGSNYVFHTENTVPLVLFSLFLCSWQKDSKISSITLKTCLKLSLVAVYFGAGLAKLTNSWATDGHMESILMWRFGQMDAYLAEPILCREIFLKPLSWLVLIFEISSIAILFNRRVSSFYFFGLLLFHAAIFTVLKINFIFPFLAPLLIVLLVRDETFYRQEQRV